MNNYLQFEPCLVLEFVTFRLCVKARYYRCVRAVAPGIFAHSPTSPEPTLLPVRAPSLRQHTARHFL